LLPSINKVGIDKVGINKVGINKVGINKVGINKVGMLQGAIFKVAVTQMDSRLLLRLGTILSKVEGGCKWKCEKSKKERKTDTCVVLRGRQVLM